MGHFVTLPNASKRHWFSGSQFFLHILKQLLTNQIVWLIGFRHERCKSIPRMKTKSNITLASLAALLFGALLFSGCNTMDGAGKDIEKGGEKIQNAVDKNR